MTSCLNWPLAEMCSGACRAASRLLRCLSLLQTFSLFLSRLCIFILLNYLIWLHLSNLEGMHNSITLNSLLYGPNNVEVMQNNLVFLEVNLFCFVHHWAAFIGMNISRCPFQIPRSKRNTQILCKHFFAVQYCHEKVYVYINFNKEIIPIVLKWNQQCAIFRTAIQTHRT